MSSTVLSLLQGYSQALYSTWLWYKPFHLLFDAGEGVALQLQNGVFGVRHLFLSHGHLDHLSGLPSLFNIRNNGLGDNVLPLTIVHPEDDLFVAWMRAYLERSVSAGDLQVDWHAVGAGERIPIDSTRSVESFATDHARGFLTLGYRLLEHRRRRRPELADRSEAELRQLAQAEGSEAVSEPYEHPLLVYGGDGLAPAVEHLRGAEVACLDGTFLAAADRGRPTHATVDEVVAAAAAAGVRHLVVLHLSGRYRLADARRAVRAAVERHGFAGVPHILWRERLLDLDGDAV